MPLIPPEDLIEQLPLAVGVFSPPEHTLRQCNEAFGRFVGRPRAVLEGLVPADLFGPLEALAFEQDFAAAAQGEVVQRECRRLIAGEPRLWSLRCQAARGQGAVLLLAQDVTEQRAAEAHRFEAAVTQRDLLVKEVHHRIKNNLQGVAGLLQQLAGRHPELSSVMGEAVAQVQAIAQVYGLQVATHGPLPLDTLVPAIAGSLQRLFGRPVSVELPTATAPEPGASRSPAAGTSSAGGVAAELADLLSHLDTGLDDAPNGELPALRWALPESESIPVALAINELITNALKHGAPHPVRCALQPQGEGVRLLITSTSRLPDGFALAAIAPGVSGLGLVKALLPRRHATLELLPAGDEVQALLSLRAPVVLPLQAETGVPDNAAERSAP